MLGVFVGIVIGIALAYGMPMAVVWCITYVKEPWKWVDIRS